MYHLIIEIIISKFIGIPDISSFRATCWKILFGYLGPKRTTWTETLSKKRALYRQFIEELVLPPGLNGNDNQDNTNSALNDHPLSEGPESAWNTFFQDNEFLLQIDKDVRRLCPDISFFQQATEYPCDIVVHSKGERRLHQRVVPTMLSSANVERKGLGITKVRNILMMAFIHTYICMCNFVNKNKKLTYSTYISCLCILFPFLQ